MTVTLDQVLAGAARPDRELLGQLVREEWITWAREQDDPKSGWLLGWDELTEPEREVDRRIGERIDRLTRAYEQTRIERALEPLYLDAAQDARIRGRFTSPRQQWWAARRSSEASAFRTALRIVRGQQ